jgi:hypothetical protein
MRRHAAGTHQDTAAGQARSVQHDRVAGNLRRDVIERCNAPHALGVQRVAFPTCHTARAQTDRRSGKYSGVLASARVIVREEGGGAMYKARPHLRRDSRVHTCPAYRAAADGAVRCCNRSAAHYRHIATGRNVAPPEAAAAAQ